ncbi:MAG: Dabb family protein [Myxococcota bacterium]
MIRHIVITNFDAKLCSDCVALLEKTRPFINQIPGILSYQIFPNASKYVPKGVISAGVEIHFKDEAALQVFMSHPKHYEANATFEAYLANPPYMVLTHKI